MNIQETGLKIKNLAEDLVSEWGIIAIVFLVAILSFLLGRLSAMEEVQPVVSVEHAASAAAAMAPGGSYVASRSGSSYYYPWCSGAERIAVGNRISFPSEAAARHAGYVPAKNCKGLGAE